MPCYKTGLILGRFQPFHKGHERIIQDALTICERLVIAIGSSNKERILGNPFSFIERKSMIERTFNNGRITIMPMEDKPEFSDQQFAKELYYLAEKASSKEIDVIFTSEKGIENFYPEFVSNKTAFHIFPRRPSFISGTEVRKLLLGDINLKELQDAISSNNEDMIKPLADIYRVVNEAFQPKPAPSERFSKC